VTDITTQLRQHQEADPTFGGLFTALHTFADRTMEEFYYDAPAMPYPVVALEKDRRNRLGYYTQRDGYTLVHRINLNPFALKTGWDAAETLAHEMVHLWQGHVGRPLKRNYHNAEFHARMALYGIETEGKLGQHKGYGARWDAWRVENEDLELERYHLPGFNAKPTRKLLKHQCSCGNTFRCRKPLAAMCLDCETEFEVVS
jgi:hypothetical protein